MSNNLFTSLLERVQFGEVKALARIISLIENNAVSYEDLIALPFSNTVIVGITGPPGAGKSTVVDALIEEMVLQEKKVGVLCVDPSSPFNLGALLGDRIRMNQWYNHPNVFIRSLATRGSLGGLHPHIIEITDVMKTAGFDFIVIETVGVGQSEIEIAGLADTTVVVVVPEAGDEIQTMKAGLMEIADIFVVNKADRPDADTFVKNLNAMSAPAFSDHQLTIPIIKTVASEKKGIKELYAAIQQQLTQLQISERKYILLAEKAFHLIEQNRMKDVSKINLIEEIKQSASSNLYQFIQTYIH
jgi:LAO/AO transport system kinase